MKKIYPCEKFLVMTSRRSARSDSRGRGGEAGEPLGTAVFGQFSLAGNRVAALHLATCVFWREIMIYRFSQAKERSSRF